MTSQARNYQWINLVVYVDLVRLVSEHSSLDNALFYPLCFSSPYQYILILYSLMYSVFVYVSLTIFFVRELRKRFFGEKVKRWIERRN